MTRLLQEEYWFLLNSWILCMWSCGLAQPLARLQATAARDQTKPNQSGLHGGTQPRRRHTSGTLLVRGAWRWARGLVSAGRPAIPRTLDEMLVARSIHSQFGSAQIGSFEFYHELS